MKTTYGLLLAPACRRTLIAAALLSAFGPAVADESEDIARLTKPSSQVSFGVGYLGNDNQRFGQYNGLRDAGFFGLFDLTLVNRDDATGTWTKLKGRNLGMENRELRYEHSHQGNWGYFLEYSELPRYFPYAIKNVPVGNGTTSVTTPGIASELNMKTERKTINFGADKVLSDGFDVQVRFRTEDKQGARQFSRYSSGAPDFFAEPIDSNISLLDANFGYTTERLQLTGGYYGTAYRNYDSMVVVNGVTDGGSRTVAPVNNATSPISLAPDNQSHQFYLTGGYNLTDSTRGTFHAAYTQATQNEAFIPVSRASGVGGDAGGRVDTTLVQVGLSTQPLPKLSVNANLRYEDRDDKTPVRLYYAPAPINATTAAPNGAPLPGNGSWDGTNEPRSIRFVTGKLEATYRLPAGYRLTGAIDYDERTRNTSAVRSVSYRENTEETSYKVELRKSMSETLNGAVAYVRSDRDGSQFLLTTLLNGTAGSNLLFPLNLADRKRDKVRLSLDWTPTEALALQLLHEFAQDRYALRVYGVERGESTFDSVDATYNLNDAWRINAWASRQDTVAQQRTLAITTPVNTAWESQLRNLGDAAGIGVRGNLRANLEVGADLQYSEDRSAFGLNRLSGSAAVAPLPEIHYRLTTLRLFSKYAVQRNAGVRVMYTYDSWASDDWTWTNYTYNNGTSFSQAPKQKVHFVGVSGYYEWR